MNKIKFNACHIHNRINNNDMNNFMNMNLFKIPGVYLAGGSLRGLFDKEDIIKDFDIFFKNSIVAAKIAVELETNGWECIFSCPKGELKTYKLSSDYTSELLNMNIKIQLITKDFYSCPSILIDTFDINACRIVFDGEYVYTERSVIRDIRRKEINLYSMNFPYATFRRIIKYKEKGYKITRECIEKYCDIVYERGASGTEINKQFYID